MPDVARYTRVAVILHWVVALLMIANIALILCVDELPENSAWIRPLIDSHKSIGITVFGLAILRLSWRVANPPPPLPAGYAGWEKTASHLAHWALYALMFLLPLSGWLHDSAWKAAAEVPLRWFGLFELPRLGSVMAMEPVAKEQFHDVAGEAHELFGFALYGLLALHILGALKHQFIDRRPELQRMR